MWRLVFATLVLWSTGCAFGADPATIRARLKSADADVRHDGVVSMAVFGLDYEDMREFPESSTDAAGRARAKSYVSRHRGQAADLRAVAVEGIASADPHVRSACCRFLRSVALNPVEDKNLLSNIAMHDSEGYVRSYAIDNMRNYPGLLTKADVDWLLKCRAGDDQNVDDALVSCFADLEAWDDKRVVAFAMRSLGRESTRSIAIAACVVARAPERIRVLATPVLIEQLDKGEYHNQLSVAENMKHFTCSKDAVLPVLRRASERNPDNRLGDDARAAIAALERSSVP